MKLAVIVEPGQPVGDGLELDLLVEPRLFDGHGGLVGENLGDFDLVFAERPVESTGELDEARGLVLDEQGDHEPRATLDVLYLHGALLLERPGHDVVADRPPLGRRRSPFALGDIRFEGALVVAQMHPDPAVDAGQQVADLGLHAVDGLAGRQRRGHRAARLEETQETLCMDLLASEQARVLERDRGLLADPGGKCKLVGRELALGFGLEEHQDAERLVL